MAAVDLGSISAEELPDFGCEPDEDITVGATGAASAIGEGSSGGDCSGAAPALAPIEGGGAGTAVPVVPAKAVGPATIAAVTATVMPALPPAPSAGLMTMVPPTVNIMISGPEEEVLPLEHDGDGWLELLRDGYFRQLREENEYPEPPPFHRAIHFGVNPGEPVPAGKFPRHALNMQLQLLQRYRTGEGFGGCKGTAFKGAPTPWFGGKGGGPSNAMAALAAAATPLLGLQGAAAQALPGLLMQLQQKGGAPGAGPQQGQLLLEAAQQLVSGKAGGNTKGRKGKGKDHLQEGGFVNGVQRTIVK